MPNNRMSNGVMSEPPPTPVIPTNRPPTNPQIEYSGSIASMAKLFTDVATGKLCLERLGRHVFSRG
jgi:hypothetical protein